MNAILFACIVLSSSTRASIEEEHAQLLQRLEAEKTALDSLSREKKSLLTLLDALERLARSSQKNVVTLEDRRERIDKKLSQARTQADTIKAALLKQETRLQPGLLTLYRFKKRVALNFFLSARDFAALMKRQKWMKMLVAQEMAQLKKLAELVRHKKLEERRLKQLEMKAHRHLQALRIESAVAKTRVVHFKKTLASIAAKQSRKRAIMAELQANEKELAGLVKELSSEARTTDFLERRGQLPYPADGHLEMGFGKVVNPRFHTVTLHGGIDLRAPMGAVVRSVAKGSVVYSGWLKGYGNLIIVDHGDKYHSLYAHLMDDKLQVGSTVEEGDALGRVGDTGSLKGAYLYFEIRRNGRAMNPLSWLKPKSNL